MKPSKFDEIIYLVKESGLGKESYLPRLKELFPSLQDDDDNFNDEFLTPYFLDKYAYNRALGLPIVEVANSIKISYTLLLKISQGFRVSIEKLVQFAEAEVFAIAEMKVTHMSILEKFEGKGSTIQFLEKAFSKQYGDKRYIGMAADFYGNQGDSEKKWTVEVVKVGNTSKISQDNLDFEEAQGDKDAECKVQEGDDASGD